MEAGQVPLRLMWKVLAKKAAKVVLVFKIHLGMHARHLLEEIVSWSLSSSFKTRPPPPHGVDSVGLSGSVHLLCLSAFSLGPLHLLRLSWWPFRPRLFQL